MEPGPPDASDADEIFDQDLTDVLEARGQELEEQSRTLLATGAATITRPEVILRATLQPPSRWRHGMLRIVAEDPASGHVQGNSSLTLRRGPRTSASLADELTIHLAMELAHGNFTTGQQ
ncbi:MAG TPA: hypothetical protein VGG25_11835 [Streptosporangiaceae bacterium]